MINTGVPHVYKLTQKRPNKQLQFIQHYLEIEIVLTTIIASNSRFNI